MRDGQEGAVEAYAERGVQVSPKEAWGADRGATLAVGAAEVGGWCRDHKGNPKLTQWTPGHGHGHGHDTV